MKSNTFKYSMLAVGVAAVLGISSTANADLAQSGSTTTNVDITNQASATYNVSDEPQPEVKSNIVKIVISEQVSFSLSADNDDTEAGGIQGDDVNIKAEVAPEGFVLFRHTLKNTGNRTDTYAVTSPLAPQNYNTAGSTTSYKIYNAEGVEDKTRTVTNAPYGDSSGIVFPLEKGHYIEFVINAKTTGNKGGDSQPLTISAVSTLLGADKTLTNTNTSFTRLPTFEIIKTITNALDLRDSNDTATYQLVINNDGNTAFSADATDITITDMLPAGLVLAEAITASNITPSTGATKGNITAGNAGTDGFTITGVNIPAGQNVTIVFKVKQGGTGTLNPATAINHAKVTDDLDDNAATNNNTLIDSTDSNDENVSTFYTTDDVDNVNGERTTGAGDDSTVPLLTIKRILDLDGITTREIAPTSGTTGQVTHQTVITNSGQDVEGDTAGELTFTITDNDGNTPNSLTPVFDTVTITYDADGAGNSAPLEPKAISPTLNNGINTYDINTALPGGIAPTGTVTINYKVASDQAPLFTPTGSKTPTSEKTTVTLKPDNEGAPTVDPVTDTTTVRGLILLKTQAIDANCDGSNVGAFVDTIIDNAFPGQCIIYKVQAQNTSTTSLGFDITNIVILDELSNFSAEADYMEGSATTTVANGTVTKNATAITTTIATLAPQATETMQFKVKIKTARVVNP